MTEKNIPPKPDVRVDLTPYAGYVEAFKGARANEQDWGHTKEKFQEFLEMLLTEAGATIGTIDGKDAIKRSEFVKDKTDWKKLKAEHPELIEQYTTQVDSKRFGTL